MYVLLQVKRSTNTDELFRNFVVLLIFSVSVCEIGRKFLKEEIKAFEFMG